MAKNSLTKEVKKIKEVEDTIIFKANTKLTLAEHKQLSEKLRYESSKTDKKIILMPFSCEIDDQK